ncbi:MFS transporter [Maribacter confluentis]|uniref:MFS transporter n=1 Tax=Maribacter confluentis TaxID=1656093 RepID=A0ABT8RMR4_9FLAO|nr:MFS transporter [Maribacter confluentis]MDO1512169.1 MFS transporter [Maribacter confluentis]
MGEKSIHKRRLLFASFFTIVAGGVGFAVRGSILVDWGNQFGFTMTELGSITGGGFAGFGVIIILFSLIVDKVGYKPLLILAFFVHFLSLVVTVATVYVFNSMGREAAYWCLFSGTFLFAVGNGICESVVNPLVATLYPKEKTHYLNILHAGWPGGMILGGLLSIAFHGILSWEVLMSFFLIPVLIYGFIIFKEKLPLSEAKEAGIPYKEMFRQFGSPLLLVLMLLMVLIGYVELGTDSWIQNITGNILENPTKGVLLFIYTSALMFVLRFFAGPIVHKISPLGLLLVCSILGAIGLYILGNSTTGLIMVFAVTIYGIAKTFFWPTMLGVVGERFPKGGAVVMGFVGGVGMLSAGLLGGPGIGYKQDYFASNHIKNEAPKAYDRYKADDNNSFLFFPPIKGLNGSKVAIVKDNGTQLDGDIERWESTGKTLNENENLSALQLWWNNAEQYALEDKEPVEQAGFYGAGRALVVTALIPVIMAIGYFILILYFKSRGGYKQIEI